MIFDIATISGLVATAVSFVFFFAMCKSGSCKVS